MAIKKITDEKTLQTTNLKALRTVVEHKFTNEEKDKLAAIDPKDLKARRDYIIELYNKYIDEVIADEAAENGNAAASNEKAGSTPTPETKESASETEEDGASVTAAKLAEQSKVGTTTNDASVSTAMSFTLTIRGAAQHNGTVSISCDKLLALVIRNTKAKFIFRSQARANEFIKILASVKTIKGVVNFSEVTRQAAIASVKEANGIK